MDLVFIVHPASFPLALENRVLGLILLLVHWRDVFHIIPFFTLILLTLIVFFPLFLIFLLWLLLYLLLFRSFLLSEIFALL